jgi:multiple sugar transport system permease protein
MATRVIPARARRRSGSLRRSSRRARSDRRAAYVLIGPAVALLAIWFVYPIVDSLILSFEKVNQFRFSERQFVGLDNFSQLLHDPAFGHSLTVTLVFVLLVVPAQTVLSLVLASALQSAGWGKAVFRTAFFVPYMTSTVAVTTVFMRLFVAGGPLADAAARIGVPNTTWYADVHLALPFLVVVYVYMYLGLYIVTFVAGMQGIPAELYEAARVDGAGAVARFRHVTVPALRPYVVFVIVAGMIQAIQIFDQAYVVSGGTVLGSPAGATSTLVVFIYQQAFRLNALGYGSAAAVVLLLIVFAGTLLTRRLLPEERSA